MAVHWDDREANRTGRRMPVVLQYVIAVVLGVAAIAGTVGALAPLL
jgi:hypothetical protein